MFYLIIINNQQYEFQQKSIINSYLTFSSMGSHRGNYVVQLRVLYLNDLAFIGTSTQTWKESKKVINSKKINMEIEIKRFLESVLYSLNREIEPLLSQRVENLGSLVDSLRTVEQLKLQKDYLTDLMQTNLDPKVTFEEFVRVQRNIILEKVSEILHSVENSPFYLHPKTVIEYGSKLERLNTISSLLDTMVKAFEGLNVMFK